METHTEHPCYEPEYDSHFELIFQLEKGLITKEQLIDKWEQEFELEDLFLFDIYVEQTCWDSVLGNGGPTDEEVTDSYYKYGEIFEEFVESKGFKFYDLRDKVKDKFDRW